jgi:pimeloyl-ACP methyl ester carboxylesterase
LVVISALIFGALVLFLIFGRGKLAERGRDKVARAQRSAELMWLTLTGRRIDVGGHRLHFECQGEGKVSVIMDAGLNQPAKTWNGIPAEVAKFTRVCVYDRAGLGDSDPARRPRTSQQIVNELHTVLAKAGIGGPYVLAGHSFGSLNVLLFASQYPNETVGLVLIDGSHVDQYKRIAENLPTAEREKYLRHEGGENFEGVNLLESAEQVRASRLPEIPLIVLSAGDDYPDVPSELRKIHDEQQALLVTLSPKGKQMIAERSRHFIQETQPELIVKAIRDVISEAHIPGAPSP